MAILTLASFYITFNIMNEEITYARSSALVSLISLEIAGAFNFRSFRKGVLNRSLLVNPLLFYASIISIIATLAIIYTPLNAIFGTAPLHLKEWCVALGVAFVSILIFDFLKKYNNKKKFFDCEG